MADVDPVLTRFLRESDMTLEKLRPVPLDSIAEAANSLGFKPIERLRLLAAIGTDRPKDGASLLSEQQEKHDLRQRETFRLAAENAQAERAAVAKVSTEELQATFMALAKAKALTPTDVLQAGYALYANPPATHYYAHTLLHKDHAERVRQHNWYVASAVANSDAFLLAYGALIMTLPVPLFPASPCFQALNIQLLREYQAWLNTHGAHGAGHPQANTPFRTTVYAGDEPTGGGTLAVQQQADGTWGVDVTAVEQAFNACWEKLLRLSDEVKRLHTASSLSDAKTIAEAVLAKLEDAKHGFGRAKGVAMRGGRGNGRGRARGLGFR